MTTIGVTGASGGLGRLVVDGLLETVDPHQLVLTTRSPESLAEYAARGVQVRRADFAEPDTLPGAFAGIDKLLLISTESLDTRLAEQSDAIAAAAKAGVRHIVYTSIPKPGDGNPALVAQSHDGTEQTLRDSGVAWTSLRNNLYTHMQVPTIEQAIASGVLYDNSGDTGTAYVTREDCAAAAVAVLTQDGHENRAYDKTGPEAVSAADLVALASELGGKDVRLASVDDAAYEAGLRDAGLPDFVAHMLTTFGISKREGFLADVSTAVADLTGKQPTSLREVATRAIKG